MVHFWGDGGVKRTGLQRSVQAWCELGMRFINGLSARVLSSLTIMNQNDIKDI